MSCRRLQRRLFSVRLSLSLSLFLSIRLSHRVPLSLPRLVFTPPHPSFPRPLSGSSFLHDRRTYFPSDDGGGRRGIKVSDVEPFTRSSAETVRVATRWKVCAFFACYPETKHYNNGCSCFPFLFFSFVFSFRC